ncbi:MAG: DNA adenine methylase [Candidatus Eremiobacteraeota bacterium]|nr:DNA adenine methylase [Candidatus Eremiobacteraeota bacterium]MBC5826108.1 DNA adenine methylase [Candidatus Eremiobacteraeota bacterium]
MDFSFEEVLSTIADENKPLLQEAGARPFVKWAGGKRSILSELLARIPKTYRTYCEPFIGGGALFFAAKPEKAYLSDVNFHLVLAFVAVRDDLDGLIANLKIHVTKHDKDYFMRARTQLSREKDPTKVAALFIYLNKTCYNGLYRVNRAGEFNVPIGSYTTPTILDDTNLRSASRSLQGVEIKQHVFSQVPVENGNFYYLDPPYHKTFDGYDSSRFGDKDHERLAAFCRALEDRRCFFMLSNSDTPFVRSLYKGFKIEKVSGARFVSCKADGRGKENELVIRNYE